MALRRVRRRLVLEPAAASAAPAACGAWSASWLGGSAWALVTGSGDENAAAGGPAGRLAARRRVRPRGASPVACSAPSDGSVDGVLVVGAI